MNDLESMLSQACEFLKKEFGIDRPKAGIKFCSAEEWRETAKKSGLDNNALEAFYNSSRNLVCVPENVSLPVLVHEYLGHALFSEQSALGRKMKAYEAQLKEAYSKEVRGDYWNFISQTKPVQEAFAIIMEKTTLELLGYNNMWDEREKNLKTRVEYPAFCSLMADICRKGFLSVLYELGFSKSSRKDILLKFALENIKSFDWLDYLIMYGSGGRDIDMLAVYNDRTELPAGHIFHQNAADILLLNTNKFMERLNLLDIELIGPLFSGNLLYGNEADFEKLVKSLAQVQPSQKTIQHALKRSFQTFNSAMFWFAKHKLHLAESAYKTNEKVIHSSPAEEIAKSFIAFNGLEQPSEYLLYAISNLSYTLTYDISAKLQANGRNIILFEEFHSLDPLFREVYSYRKDVEHNRTKLEEHKVKGFLDIVQQRRLIC